jgi:predicted permease
MPGVTSAAMVSGLPLTGSLYGSKFIVRNAPDANGTATGVVVSPSYFQTVGIPLRTGRIFEPTDTDLGPRFAVVNQALADRYFPNENPIGKQIRWEGAAPSSPFATIIGVVGNIRDNDIAEDPSPEVYSSYLQVGSYFLKTALLVRTEPQSGDVGKSVRQQIQQLDPDQPVNGILPMRRILDRSLGPQRFIALMLALLAAISLVLAAAGIYGVVSNTVGRRTREIGIRVALGAGRGEILEMILRRELPPVLVGIAVGCIGAAACSRTIAGLLHGITSTDLPTFVSITLFLLGVAVTAIYIPARRAMTIAPMNALRHE